LERFNETPSWVLDRHSSDGRRFLRSSILKPLIEITEIKKRQDAIEYLLDDFELLDELRTSLRKVWIGRLSSGKFKNADARPHSDQNSVLALPKMKIPEFFQNSTSGHSRKNCRNSPI
jgi:DNA mismatch repair protein MutS